MIKQLAVTALLTLTMVSLPSFALGLGEIHVSSELNEPLEAQVNLLDSDKLDGQIVVGLASKEAYELVDADRTYFLTTIEFHLLKDAAGNYYVEMTTDERISEPFVNIIIEAKWPNGRIIREYTLLIDPPKQPSDMISATAVINSIQLAAMM